MSIKVTKTLQGDLVEIDDIDFKVLAIVNITNWFFKVKLLSADGLNYEFAKEEVLKRYNEFEYEKILLILKEVNLLSFSEYENIVDLNNNSYARYEALVDGEYIKALKEQDK